MRFLPKGCVDLVITDPPYGVGYKEDGGRRIQNDSSDFSWLVPAAREIHRVLKRNGLLFSFYGWPHVDLFMAAWKGEGFCPVSEIIFVKGYGSTRRAQNAKNPNPAGKKKNPYFTIGKHESAHLLRKQGVSPPRPEDPLPDVLPWVYSGNKYHPTEKAVEVIRPLILTYSRPGEIVLDPFAGSAPVAIAALETRRRFIAIEVDPEYCRIARERVDEFLKTLP